MRRRTLAGLLAAELVSSLGSQLTRLALPWFVLVETGSPARMAFVFAAQLLPVALLGLPSGALVQRIGSRTTMIGADLGRAPIIALVPLLHALNLLSFPLLLVIAVALGALSTPYYAAQRLILPELVAENERAVARANSLLEGTTEAASLLGPALAGLLIALIGAANVLWLDAASFLLSGLVLLLLVPARGRTANDGQPRGFLAGLRFLLGDPLLRPIVLSTLLFGLAGPMLFAALPYLAFARFDQDPKIAGLLLASWGAGAVAGSAVTFHLVAHLPPLQVAGIGVIGFVTPLWSLRSSCRPGRSQRCSRSPVLPTRSRTRSSQCSPCAFRSRASDDSSAHHESTHRAARLCTCGAPVTRHRHHLSVVLVAAIDTIAAAIFLSGAFRPHSRP